VLPGRRDIARAIDPDHTGRQLQGGQLTDAIADTTRLCRTDPDALAARAEQLYTDLLHRADRAAGLPDALVVTALAGRTPHPHAAPICTSWPSSPTAPATAPYPVVGSFGSAIIDDTIRSALPCRFRHTVTIVSPSGW